MLSSGLDLSSINVARESRALPGKNYYYYYYYYYYHWYMTCTQQIIII